jgi:TRAP transporter TAXI family solute receptor
MFRPLAFAAALTLSAVAAHAQTVALGTTKGGATAQVSNALANVISKGSSLMVRPQAMANTSQYLPLVESGRVEFGIANFPQAAFSVRGVAMSEGQATPSLRMVATLIPFNVGILSPSSLGISDISGLKGKKVPKFADDALGDYIIKAVLATAGLTYDDVVSVPTANFPAMFSGVKDGVLDMTIAAVGSQPTYDIEASVGGVTFLTFKRSDQASLEAALPGTTIKSWEGAPVMPGIGPDTLTFSYPYMMFANAGVSDDVVAAAVKALFEGEEALKANGPLWAEYDPAGLAGSQGLEYHPGAIAYFKSVGIWPAN